MSNRTTINVDKDSHEKAGDVKDEYDETWPEVLQFYAEYRPQVDSGKLNTDTEPMRVVPIKEVAGRKVPAQSVDFTPLLGRIDDLEVELKSKIEKEAPER